MNFQILINIAVSAAHICMVAVGFGIIYRTVRFFHFAHAGIYTVSAYMVYAADNLLGGTILFGIAAGVATGIVLGGLIEMVIYRPLRKVGASSVVLLVSSLGTLIVLQNVISLFFGDETRSIHLASGTQQGLQILGARITPVQIIILGNALSTGLLLAVLLKVTRLGITLRAVANDSTLAESVGVDVDGAILVSFLIGSGVAGLAGVLWAYNTALSPLMGFNALLLGVVAAIVGGVGSLPGAFIGAILVAGAQHIAMWQFSSEWQDAVVFIILIFFLLLRPQGFLGNPLRKATM